MGQLLGMWRLCEAVADLTPGYPRVGCSPWHLGSRSRDLLEQKVFGFSDEFTEVEQPYFDGRNDLLPSHS